MCFWLRSFFPDFVCVFEKGAGAVFLRVSVCERQTLTFFLVQFQRLMKWKEGVALERRS